MQAFLENIAETNRSHRHWVARFFERVIIDDGCWAWGGTHDRDGYPKQISVGSRGVVRVHRLIHEMFNGPIPEGYDVDHTCRNRGRINPSHLEAVTHRENMHRSPNVAWKKRMAQTHCKHGHSLSDAYVTKDGHRECRVCVCERSRRYRARTNP